MFDRIRAALFDIICGMRYRVEIRRTEVCHLEVDADDEHKARELALMKEQSGDVCDYSYEDESLFVYSLKGSRRKK